MKTLSHAIGGWPLEDRPREKLSKQGEHCLTDSELLAIILRTGRRGQSALDLARAILTKFGSFRQMSDVPFKEWKTVKGLGIAKIAQIKSAIEIGRRFGEDQLKDGRATVGSSRDIADLLMPRLRDLKREVVKTVFLNPQNKIIAVTEAEEGTVNCASPIIREIFREALEHSASALICAHNHPGGEPTPSPEDHVFTRELEQAGRVLGIAVLDHIILGDGVYYSFADHGKLSGAAGKLSC